MKNYNNRKKITKLCFFSFANWHFKKLKLTKLFSFEVLKSCFYLLCPLLFSLHRDRQRYIHTYRNIFKGDKLFFKNCKGNNFFLDALFQRQNYPFLSNWKLRVVWNCQNNVITQWYLKSLIYHSKSIFVTSTIRKNIF